MVQISEYYIYFGSLKKSVVLNYINRKESSTLKAFVEMPFEKKLAGSGGAHEYAIKREGYYFSSRPGIGGIYKR